MLTFRLSCVLSRFWYLSSQYARYPGVELRTTFCFRSYCPTLTHMPRTNCSTWTTKVVGNNLKIVYTHTRLTALCPGLPGWAGTRKVKPIWILLKKETVSGSGISWTVCKSAPCSRQITTPAPHRSVFTGRMPFLPPNQQRQSTEGNTEHIQIA